MKTQPNDPISTPYHTDGSPMTVHSFDENFGAFIGLIKREYIAIKMHASLLIAIHASTPKGEYTGWSPEEIASTALLHTDAIINALNDNL